MGLLKIKVVCVTWKKDFLVHKLTNFLVQSTYKLQLWLNLIGVNLTIEEASLLIEDYPTLIEDHGMQQSVKQNTFRYNTKFWRNAEPFKIRYFNFFRGFCINNLSKITKLVCSMKNWRVLAEVDRRDLKNITAYWGSLLSI